jgi:hypothetical protein
MYIPSSVLSCSGVSNKQYTQSPDKPSEPSIHEDSVTSSEELTTSKPHSSHFGEFSGNINSLGYDHGTVAFTVDGKLEKAIFYHQKVYVNGIRIRSLSQLHEVVSLEMPVTLNVKRYEGETFMYKATAVYVELNDAEQLEGFEFASKQKAASDVVSVKSESSGLSHRSLQKNTVVSVDQTATNFETCLPLQCWDNFCAGNVGVRKYMKERVSRTCFHESNLMSTDSCKCSQAGMFTSPRKGTNITEIISTAREDTAINECVSEETPNVASNGVLKSEEKIAIPEDEEEKVTASKLHTEFIPPDIVKQSLVMDKMTESANDPGEVFMLNTLGIDNPVGFLPQAAAQITDKITVSDNDQEQLFTYKTNTSDVASSLGSLPQSARCVAGVIDGVWMNNAVLMRATMKGVTLTVLIDRRNLYIKRQRCTDTNTQWQHLLQGMQVFADVSELNDHPSGATYIATYAWTGKKPGSGIPCHIRPCGTETCVSCVKKPLSSDIDASTGGSKVKTDAEKQKSKHCKPDDIKYRTENTGTCRDKAVPSDKSHSIQRKADASVEEKKQKYHKTIKIMKSLVGKKFVGTVERFAMDDGFGVVNFQLQNKVKGVFFRENIFSKGISVADSYVEGKICAGRLVVVSAVKPSCREDIPYAVDIDTEFEDRQSDPETRSYADAVSCRSEQEEVTPTVEDLELQSCKFTVKEREMFCKRRWFYDWGKGSIADSDRYKGTEVTDHPEEVKVEKLCCDETVGDANVTTSLSDEVEASDHLGEVKVEKLLCLDKRVSDANVTVSSDNKGAVVTSHSDEPFCQEETLGEASVTASLDNKITEVTDHSDEAKRKRPLCQEETSGNAVVTASSGNKQLVQLPVTSTQHTGLAKQLKQKLARVKRYESSTTGILECSISGAVLEVMFDRSVVSFYRNNKITDVREHLPVNSEVYFDGEVVGEDSLLGCSDIVVTSVWKSKAHTKATNSKLRHSLALTLTYPSLYEGLVPGKIYEGIITKVLPPRAFVATVTEAAKNYDVFVYNTFFSPVEYGEKLPADHWIMPYVDKGYKVHLVVDRMQEVNAKYTYQWFAVDAWTEEGYNTFTGCTPKTWFASSELSDHQEGVMDVYHHDHQKGVIMTLYPEWGVLNVDHLKDEVTFFAQDTFLFGVQLTNVDLRKLFSPGESHPICVNLNRTRVSSI